MACPARICGRKPPFVRRNHEDKRITRFDVGVGQYRLLGMLPTLPEKNRRRSGAGNDRRRDREFTQQWLRQTALIYYTALIISGLLVYAALQMRKLQRHELCLLASILAMTPLT